MSKNNKYDTLSQAVKELNNQGFKEEIEVKSENNISFGDQTFGADEIEITEYHRFEGMSNPSDMSVIYAVESKDTDHKGVIIDVYGAGSSNTLAEFLKKVPIDE